MAFFQVLPKETGIAERFGEGFGQAFGGTLQERLGQFFDEKKKDKTLQNFFSSEFGQKLSDENKSLIAGYAKGLLPPQALTQALSQVDPEVEAQNFEIMKDAFGEKFAKIWKAAGQGERTALTNAALDARLRGINIEDLLTQAGLAPDKKGGLQLPEGEDTISIGDQLDTPQGEIQFQERVDFPDYSLDTSGMTPKDINTYKSSLRKENTKPFQEANAKSKASEAELSSISALKKLNETRKLPETIGQQIGQGINPLTGRIILPKLASTEAQTFEKTINDFTTKAKDTFGARVTNFELQQFMARLPRLINSYEGRKAIIEQMELISQINSLYNKSLRDVYQNYGLGNITPEDAERIAEHRIRDQVRNLADRYQRIDERIKKIDTGQTKEFNLKKPPDPSKHTGRTIEDNKGNRYKSTGKTWRKL
jgi:hypothetical protein